MDIQTSLNLSKVGRAKEEQNGGLEQKKVREGGKSHLSSTFSKLKEKPTAQSNKKKKIAGKKRRKQ